MKCLQKILKVSLNVLFWVVIVALVGVTLITLYARIGTDGRSLIGGIGFGRVVTGSMEPVIPTGSFIVIRDSDVTALEIGDVITFYSQDPSVPEDAPVSHQIIRIEQDDTGEGVFITKGTANDTEDSYPVHEEDILGEVVFSSLWIGKIIGLSQSRYVYPILIVLLAVSMIQSIVDIIKQVVSLKASDDHGK